MDFIITEYVQIAKNVNLTYFFKQTDRYKYQNYVFPFVCDWLVVDMTWHEPKRYVIE